MATPVTQQTRLMRKIIYFVVILALFTLSLVHRKFIVYPQAEALQLREVSRGEVELTGSAVRLMLTGSRGIAVTLLWYNAMDKQKRNEWHELEMLVTSITKLQPYFITPWLYQSWNISFNVAVECDRPRDKYYYIGQGLKLLSEGERRNRGTESADPNAIVFPGHPELRHHMGFTYQLKIGTSDERLTMRSLLEMSCIDPIERNPDRYLDLDQNGQQVVKADEFAKFCQNHPRLVRRLREQLAFAPMDIVKFMRDHQEIPTRFEPFAKPNQTQSELKKVPDQFPILPPPERGWPNPKNADMTSESIDVFLICRTWYEFAQKPLPPPDTKPGPEAQQFDKLRHRLPKQMVTQLFRQYPARAQVYIAETLESEGWFDGEGWRIEKWFESDEMVVGRDPKYHSRLAWQRSYDAYKDYGERNMIYLTPQQIAKLELAAKPFREAAKMGPGMMPQNPAEWREGAMGVSFDAHSLLHYSEYYRRLSNFEAFFYQAEGERDPITVAARKLLFRAERQRKQLAHELMLDDYNAAWPLYIHACLKYPKFAQVSSMQEDFYEVYQHYMGQTQVVRSELFKKKALLFAKVPFGPYPAEIAEPTNEQLEDLVAQFAHWPTSNWREAIARHALVTYKEKDQQAMNSVAKMKKRTGDLDTIQYYDGPEANALRNWLFQWTTGAGASGALTVDGLLSQAVSHPSQSTFLLTRKVSDLETNVPNWPFLITAETRRITANRLGLDR